MKAFTIVATWVAVCAALIFMAGTPGAPGAQVIDATACSNACERRQGECMQQCAEHPNPMDCESECRERAEDCLDACPLPD